MYRRYGRTRRIQEHAAARSRSRPICDLESEGALVVVIVVVLVLLVLLILLLLLILLILVNGRDLYIKRPSFILFTFIDISVPVLTLGERAGGVSR